MGSSDMIEGIIPYSFKDIFERRQSLMDAGTASVEITMSFMEIYMEECFDLLSRDGEKKKLELRESSSGETYLDGITSCPIDDITTVAQYLTEAAKIRSTGRTAMNNTSSRSHAICTVSLKIVKEDVAVVSKLHLVDLGIQLPLLSPSSSSLPPPSLSLSPPLSPLLPQLKLPLP
jgi:hypothetical protein